MRDWRAVTLLVVAAVAAFLYSNFIFDWVLPGEHDWWVVVSELEQEGARYAHLLRTTDVICGLFTLALLPFVWVALPADGWRKAGVWLTAIFAIFSAMSGIISLPCGLDDSSCPGTGATIQRSMHDGLSILSNTALFLGAVAIAVDAKKHGPQWLKVNAWFTFWVGGVLGTVAFGLFAAINSSSWETGAAQRFQIVVMSYWILCLGWYAATDGLRAWDARSEAAGPRRSV